MNVVGRDEPRVTPLSISDARLSACMFDGSLSISKPKFKSTEKRVWWHEGKWHTIEPLRLVKIPHLVMTKCKIVQALSPSCRFSSIYFCTTQYEVESIHGSMDIAEDQTSTCLAITAPLPPGFPSLGSSLAPMHSWTWFEQWYAIAPVLSGIVILAPKENRVSVMSIGTEKRNEITRTWSSSYDSDTSASAA